MPDSEVRRRVLARRLCSGCGVDYNLIENSPDVPGKCDNCGGELVQREDDTEEALAVRLREYHEKTEPEVVQQAIRNGLALPPYHPVQAAGQR